MYKLREKGRFLCYVSSVIQEDFSPFSAKKLTFPLIGVFFEWRNPLLFGKILLNLHKTPFCMNFPVTEILKEKQEGLLCREKWNCAA